MRDLRLHWVTYALPMRVNKLKRDRKRIEDAPRPGTPKSAVVAEKIDKVYDIVLANRRVKVRELAEAESILIDRIHFILHHELHIKKTERPVSAAFAD